MLFSVHILPNGKAIEGVVTELDYNIADKLSKAPQPVLIYLGLCSQNSTFNCEH